MKKWEKWKKGELKPRALPIKDEKEAKKWLAEHYDWGGSKAIYNEKQDIIQLGKIVASHFNKKDLAKKILEVHPLHYDKSKIWWAWNKNSYGWEIVDETDIMNIVGMLTTANTVQSKEKNEILESLKQEARLQEPEPIKKTWIQFKDIIVDIKTGERFKAESKYFVTNPIPWQLNEDNFEDTSTIDRIFEEWVGEEYVKTLYEIIAYCLLPDYPIHRLFCAIGGGLNGKSCFERLLVKFVGGKNVTSTELDTLLTSRFEITRLHKKLICIMGETNFAEINRTSIIKKLTGQDVIGFEYKNKDPFEDNNYAKIIIATNNLPTTTDKTIGFYRRWCIVDFFNEFSEEKDILEDIPDSEYECLALKSLAILKDLLEKRKFHKEGTIQDRMKKYEEKSNPFEKFWNENVSEDGTGWLWKHSFRDTLRDWCKEHRFRELTDHAIAREMKFKGIETQRKEADFIDKYGNKPRWNAWVGINWKENIENVKDVKDVKVFPI